MADVTFSPVTNLLIFTSSQGGGRSFIFTSVTHCPIFSSSSMFFLSIFTSSHPHIFTSSHLHIFSSSHLLIFTSSHLLIFTCAHLHIFTSAHLHIFSSSHLHIFTSSHLHIFSSCLLALLPSCPHIFTSSPLVLDGTKRNPFARNEVRSPKTEVKLRFRLVRRNPFARNEVRSPKTEEKELYLIQGCLNLIWGLNSSLQSWF